MKKDINELISRIISCSQKGEYDICDFHAALIGAIVSVETALAQTFLTVEQSEEATDKGIAFEREQAKIQLAQPNN